MEYTTNAPKGAALLDKRMPGWADRIDLGTFAIEKYDRCVLGQLYGMYSNGLAVLFSESDANELHGSGPGYDYGFNHPWSLDDDRVDVDTAFDVLGAEWRELIRERKTA